MLKVGELICQTTVLAVWPLVLQKPASAYGAARGALAICSPVFEEVRMTTQSNDQLALTPQTSFAGPALTFDFPGLEIGIAEYEEGPTGCTVFHFPEGVLSTVDVRGGAPGVMGDYGWSHAICLAGGSLYGLEATTGVSAELFARRSYSTHWGEIGLVAGAIIYDYGRRSNAIYPDKALGRAALRAARPGVFPLGARGAGRSAGVGAGLNWDGFEPGGQGGAFRQVGELRIAVFTVVNALGIIHDRQGNAVRGGLDRGTGQRRSFHAQLESHLAGGGSPSTRPGNTTLSVLVTNAKLDYRSLQQLGRAVHSSLARVIQPFHTLDDGDVLFAVTTGAVETQLSPTALSVIGAELAWDAVLAAVGAA
jgi:L-aminopeptidase/D-esterase-like protein